MPDLNKLPGLPKLPDLITKSQPVVDPTGIITEPTFAEKQARKFARGNAQAKLDVLREFEEKSLAENALDVLGNAGAELKDIVLGIPLIGFHVAKSGLSAAANPIDTLESITSGEAWDSIKDGALELLEGISDDYKQRYGGLFEGDFEDFSEQLQDKPLSFLLDLGGALSLAGGVARGAGSAVAKRTGSQALQKTGLVLTRAGQVLDPFQIAKGGVTKLGDKLPNLPIVGREARVARHLRKHAQGVSVDELRAVRKQAMDELVDEERLAGQLTTEQLEAIGPHLSGIDIIPDSQLRDNPALKQYLDLTRRVTSDPKNADLFLIPRSTAEKRRLFPSIAKKLRDGEINLSEPMRSRMVQEGFLVADDAATSGFRLRAPSGIENLPDDFMNTARNALGPSDHLEYFPLLDAEKNLNLTDFIGRVGNKFDRPEAGITKSFTGDILGKLLKDKNKSLIANASEVNRMMIVERANEKFIQKLGTKLINLKDPVTGQRLAKPVFQGKMPKNIAGFTNAQDFVDIANAMDNPLSGRSIDDIHKQLLGETKPRLLSRIRRERSIDTNAAEKVLEQQLQLSMADKGFDGFIATNGEFLFADPTRNPFNQLLDDHVVFSPRYLAKAARNQREMAERVAKGLDKGESIEQAAKAAGAELFPEGDKAYNAIREELRAAGKANTDVLDTTLLEGDRLDRFISTIQGGARRNIKLDKELIKKRLAQYKTNVAKLGDGESLAQHMHGYQIPRSLARGINDSIRPNTMSNHFLRQFYDTPLNLWRLSVLNFSPRWHVNNVAGGIALNTAAGVLNPMDYMRAGDLLMYRLSKRFPKAIGAPRALIRKITGLSDDGFERARKLDNLLPPELGLGTFAREENYALDLLQAADTPLDKWRSKILANRVGRNVAKGAQASADFNSLVDRMFRETQFLNLVKGQVRKNKRGLVKRIMSKFYVSDDEIFKTLTNMTDDTRTSLVKKVNEWLPDYQKLLNAEERGVIRRLLPFYSWYKHMFGVAMMMPLKHPKRTVLIRDLANIAKDINDEEFRENGIDPKDIRLAARWLEGAGIVGKGKVGTKFLSLRGVNPFHTILDFADIGNALTPPVRIAIEQIAGVELFSGRPFPRKVVLDKDGQPQLVREDNVIEALGEAAVRQVPIAELSRRLIDPEIKSKSGEVVFRRDRMMEIMKMMGIPMNERNLDDLKQRAHRKRGALIGRGFNNLLKSKRQDPEFAKDVLDFLTQRGQ